VACRGESETEKQSACKVVDVGLARTLACHRSGAMRCSRPLPPLQTFAWPRWCVNDRLQLIISASFRASPHSNWSVYGGGGGGGGSELEVITVCASGCNRTQVFEAVLLAKANDELLLTGDLLNQTSVNVTIPLTITCVIEHIPPPSLCLRFAHPAGDELWDSLCFSPLFGPGSVAQDASVAASLATGGSHWLSVHSNVTLSGALSITCAPTRLGAASLCVWMVGFGAVTSHAHTHVSLSVCWLGQLRPHQGWCTWAQGPPWLRRPACWRLASTPTLVS
jgi:hypothetical protein